MGRERVPLRLVFAFITVLALLYFLYIFAEASSYQNRTVHLSLSFPALVEYSFFSLLRMSAAYFLSLVFSLLYGYAAAKSKKAEAVLIPLLDVLQSVPILSFLPVTLLALSAFLPVGVAAELASVVLIFTSQAWNIAFAWYQSLITVPKDLDEASRIFRLNWWLRFRNLELPFGAISLIWNSMMSWAGGWFFLMAAEMFTVGNKDFRLPGLGSYLQTAADRKDFHALFMGLVALVLIIVLLDQFVWKPLLAWAERFKLQQTSDEREYTSWFYDFLRKRRWFQNLTDLLSELLEKLDGFFVKKFPPSEERSSKLNFLGNLLFYLFAVFVLYEGIKAVILMVKLPSEEWLAIAEGLLFTTLRVFIAILLSLLWTVPLGVLIGRNPRLRKWLQPLVQIVASVPATALFPVFLLLFLHLPMGLNLASVVLMMAGTQWYILFNVIAGASAIPKELEYTADLLHLSGWEKWKILILPAVFPYVITGTITAAGGAWNASIVAEYITFGGHTYSIPGLGELISIATADGDYKLLFTSTVVMIAAVVLINRIVWRKLYGLAREKYRLE